jgi:hypothetical protein
MFHTRVMLIGHAYGSTVIFWDLEHGKLCINPQSSSLAVVILLYIKLRRHAAEANVSTAGAQHECATLSSIRPHICPWSFDTIIPSTSLLAFVAGLYRVTCTP